MHALRASVARRRGPEGAKRSPAGELCACAAAMSRNLCHGGVLDRLSVLSCWTPQGGLVGTIGGVRLTGDNLTRG
jgi:hypothetical protein